MTGKHLSAIRQIGAGLRNAMQTTGETDVGQVPSTPPVERPAPQPAPAPPPAAGPETVPGEDRIPKHRLDEVIAARDAERAARATAEQQLAALREQMKSKDVTTSLAELLTEERRPENWDRWNTDQQQAWIAREAARVTVEDVLGPNSGDIKQLLVGQRVSAELNESLTPAQVGAIAAVKVQNPGLSAAECRTLAAVRQPGLWANQSQPVVPSSHQTTPKGEGARDQRPPSPEEATRAELLAARTPDGRVRAATKLLAQKLIQPGEKNRLAVQGWK